MKWIVKRQIDDLRAGETASPTWYWMQRDGSWSANVRHARVFRLLANAENVARHFGGNARAEPEE